MAGTSIPEAARELLESDAVAHVVTLNEDGSPQVTAAWVGVEGDGIVLATIPRRSCGTSAETRAWRSRCRPRR